MVFGMISILVGFIGIISFVGGPVLAGVLLVVALILGILALIRLYRGFKMLTPYVPNANLGRIGSILLVIPILDLIGVILVGLALYFVGEKYNNGTTKVGGILTAIPIGFISFIGFIVSYVGLGNILYQVPASLTPQTPQVQQPAQVYQVGQGSLRGNVATLTLYSNLPIGLTSATIEGLASTAVAIQPSSLKPGENRVEITFSYVPPAVVQGTEYKLRLLLENGSTVYATVTS
ncbi:hypothetical protein GCM10007116_07590 [Sulfodiicoccus acidiphilus]|nr:hypothetical protein GCM10007116_07590 [Sulfodiicoccus acidiphilus]